MGQKNSGNQKKKEIPAIQTETEKWLLRKTDEIQLVAKSIFGLNAKPEIPIPYGI